MQKLGVLVGLEEEAALFSSVFPKSLIALSHARREDALNAVKSLKRAGVTHLLSFGYAGGLSEEVSPGTILICNSVMENGHVYSADPYLTKRLRGSDKGDGVILSSDKIITKSREKIFLAKETGCLAVDMESGAVALSGLPFAILRGVCDDCYTDLPPAAIKGIKNGRLYWRGILLSILSHPSQIPALIRLGRQRKKAKKNMKAFLKNLKISPL